MRHLGRTTTLTPFGSRPALNRLKMSSASSSVNWLLRSTSSVLNDGTSPHSTHLNTSKDGSASTVKTSSDGKESAE